MLAGAGAEVLQRLAVGHGIDARIHRRCALYARLLLSGERAQLNSPQHNA